MLDTSTSNLNAALPEMSDENLMLAFQAGDAAAFEHLYQNNKVMVYQYFIRNGASAAVAEELCHDTWTKLIQRLSHYQASARFRTYLFTIARNLLVDFYRKKEHQISHQSFDETNESEQDKPLQNAQTQLELQQALKMQIALLPFEQKEVFILKQESGFTLEEISKITENHLEKVKSCWRYAIAKIRAGLTDYVK